MYIFYSVDKMILDELTKILLPVMNRLDWAL